MSNLIRFGVVGLLLTFGALSSASPPEPRPTPIPFGYYPTQWRPFPTTIREPEVRIVAPTKQPDLPDAIRVQPANPKQPNVVPPAPGPKKIFPPDYIPEVTPIYREPMLPEIRVPKVEPEIKVLHPAIEPPPTIKPQILNLMPENGSFRRTDPFKKAGEEESEPQKLKKDLGPKAWLEMPVPFIR